MLEIGLVLTSLYFISRSKLFPVLGVISTVAGIATAVSGLFLYRGRRAGIGETALLRAG